MMQGCFGQSRDQASMYAIPCLVGSRAEATVGTVQVVLHSFYPVAHV